MNTAQLLLAALAPAFMPATVEGFGDLQIKQLTVAENDQVRALVKTGAPASEFGLRMLLASVVDVDGNAVFTEEHLPALQSSGGYKVDALIKQVLEANGYKGTPEKNSQS